MLVIQSVQTRVITLLSDDIEYSGQTLFRDVALDRK